MAPFGYLISVTTLKQGTGLLLKILNTAGMGYTFYAETNDDRSIECWFIPNGKNNKREIICALKDFVEVINVSVVKLSKPLKRGELSNVRELFADIGWDSSEVTDAELSLYINTKLKGENTYYLDFDHSQKLKGSVKIAVAPIQSHPHFSEDWLRVIEYVQGEPDKELTLEDIEVKEVVIDVPVIPPRLDLSKTDD